MTTTDPKDKVILQTATLTMALAIMRIMDGGCRDDGVVVAMIEEVAKNIKAAFPEESYISAAELFRGMEKPE